MTRKLDLCVVIDCTESMEGYIVQLKKVVKNVAAKISKSSDYCPRFALVEYRDHTDDFVTRPHEFGSLETMQGYIDECKATGGGDIPEAVADALHEVLSLKWDENSVKICMLITDAPPHGLLNEKDDENPGGCPDQHDPIILARKMKDKGITLYVIGCEPNIVKYKEWYSGLAYITEGRYISLEAAESLSKVIKAVVDHLNLMDKIQQLIEKQFLCIVKESNERVDSSQITTLICKKLKPQWIKKENTFNEVAFFTPTDRTLTISKFNSLEEYKEKYKAYDPKPAKSIETDLCSREQHEGTPEELLLQVNLFIDNILPKLEQFLDWQIPPSPCKTSVGIQAIAAMDKQLDLCLVIDTTSSMHEYIDQLKTVSRDVVSEIHQSTEFSTRYALVEYRDHPPHFNSFISRSQQFTPSLDEIEGHINSAEAAEQVEDALISTGGDEPEAVADALNEANNLDWQKEAVKICILITDAPPHGLIQEGKDNHETGCPCNLDPMALARKMDDKGIILYIIGCEKKITEYKDWYSGLAHLSGGLYMPLTEAKRLPKVIIESVKDVRKMYDIKLEVEKKFLNILRECDSQTDTNKFAELIFEDLKQEWIEASSSTSNCKFFEPTHRAIDFSKLQSMAECKKKFLSYEDDPASGTGPLICLSDTRSDEDKKEETVDDLKLQVKRVVNQITKKCEAIFGFKPRSKCVGIQVRKAPNGVDSGVQTAETYFNDIGTQSAPDCIDIGIQPVPHDTDIGIQNTWVQFKTPQIAEQIFWFGSFFRIVSAMSLFVQYISKKTHTM